MQVGIVYEGALLGVGSRGARGAGRSAADEGENNFQCSDALKRLKQVTQPQKHHLHELKILRGVPAAGT